MCRKQNRWCNLIWTILDNFRECSQAFQSIIAAVAEMERENIRVQTMAGREQKAREGKWNGGFAPYGYRLENGELVIAEDEVEIIQMIFDRYIHTNDGINGVANYLNNHGYTKKLYKMSLLWKRNVWKYW